MEYLILIAGFLVLAVSGNYLIEGSVSLARHLKISTLVVGVVVVSFGTSAPELIVSLQAALNGHPDIAIGNVIGSNISNIALVLGITALLLPIPVKSNSIKIDWPVMMLSSILLYVFILNYIIERWEGAILITSIIVFIYWSIRSSRKKTENNNNIDKPKHKLYLAIIFIIVSCIGLVFGAKLFINSSVEIARNFDISERVISVTLVAFGTSVPELVASIVAVFKKQMDISIGNIIGSNIFNVLAIIGITSIVTPISNIDKGIVNFDIFWMLGISALLFLFIIPLKGGILNRWKGLLFLIFYAVYIFLLFYLKK